MIEERMAWGLSIIHSPWFSEHPIETWSCPDTWEMLGVWEWLSLRVWLQAEGGTPKSVGMNNFIFMIIFHVLDFWYHIFLL